MSRTLSEHDIALLLKLTPECDTLLIYKGSKNTYRSILAPMENHYAKDMDDFVARLNRLSDGELVGSCGYDPGRKRRDRVSTSRVCGGAD